MSEQNVQMIIEALEEKMTKMTNEEAVYVLNLLKRQDLKINSAATEAIDMAISALEKQIPKKPNRIDKNASFDGNWKKMCPACGRVLVERITTPEESYPRIYNHTPHCICGQAIDWSEQLYMEVEQ